MPGEVDARARLKEIKAELRAMLLAPGARHAARAQRLTAEALRLKATLRPTPRSEPAAERSVAPPSGLSEQDAAAIATWPAELRARVYGGSMSRTILPWRD
jgi:hypothetical protein